MLRAREHAVDRRAVAVVAPDLEHVAEIHRERARHGLDEHELLAALHLEARVLVLPEHA